jgi:hypothetical protein
MIVDEEAGQITLRGFIDESRFHFQSLRLTTSISTGFGSDSFTWTDEVENIGGRDAKLQMLYHFNIGQPLLQPDAKITAPLGTVAPLTQTAAKAGIESWNIMPAPRPGSNEQVYVLDLAADSSGDTGILVSNLSNDQAVSLQFNKTNLPCFSVWRNTPAESDGYVLGIEPGTNYPNPRSFEQRHHRVVELKPGARWQASVTARWMTDQKSISREADVLKAIQGSARPQLLPAPRPEWSVIVD